MLMSVKTDGRSPVSERQSEHKGEAPVSGWRERKVFTRRRQQSGYCLSASEFSRFGLNLKMTKPLLALRRVTGPQRLKPLTLTLRRKCAVSSPLAFLLTAWLAPINEPASAVADDFGSLAPIRFLGNEKSDCERSAESGGLTRSETRLSRAIKTSKAPDRAEEKNYCKKMLNRGAQLQSQHSMLQHDRVMIKI